MKKHFLFLLIILTGYSGFSQRFKVVTATNSPPYKKHYSHSIEGGFVNGQPRQFVVGNKTDWLMNNRNVVGQAINGTNFVGRDCYLTIVPPDELDKIQLTDFTIYPTEDYQYGAGTGVYYPTGVTGMGYPYLAIYDKVTMEVVNSYFYNLTYPNGQDPSNAIGLRIIYSSEMASFYISGVMADRSFADINMDNIVGKSKGFIMKISTNDFTNANVLVIEPDNLATDDPILCSVHDLEISPDGRYIAFTGITTKADFLGGYHHPMVGKINTNLVVQWCNAYQFTSDKYSGVDVEFNTLDEKLLVLVNSARYPFAVMELDYNGLITQQPVSYELYEGSGLSSQQGSARAHKLHYLNGSITITGNNFVNSGNTYGDQLLFSYIIPDATALNLGNATYNSYSREAVPLGSQKAVTGYWAPENSIYQEGNLAIVGIYNNANLTFGYTLIEVNGFVNEEGCLETGDVESDGFTPVRDDIPTYLTSCTGELFDVDDIDFNSLPTQECPIADPGTKSSSTGMENGNTSQMWQYKGIDAQGIHATLFSESNNTRYEVVVYDMMGRKITSSSYNVSGGQQEIYLEFAVKAEMYMIRVNNGSQSQTLKVAGNL